MELAQMILAVLQARMGSSRLPGKALKPILGKPMLLHQIERIQKSRRVEKLMVATSRLPEDDEIETLCLKNKLEFYRGSLDDVLDRFYQAALCFMPQHVVRLTGDCPLLDPKLMDAVIEFHNKGTQDYSSNTLQPTFPDGLDVEVMRWPALEAAWKEARLSSDREHVTSFIYKHPERFKLANYAGTEDLSMLRWTVDDKKDLAFVEQVYTALYPSKKDFGMAQILDFIRKDPAARQNRSTAKRNEGYRRSLLKDKTT